MEHVRVSQVHKICVHCCRCLLEVSAGQRTVRAFCWHTLARVHILRGHQWQPLPQCAASGTFAVLLQDALWWQHHWFRGFPRMQSKRVAVADQACETALLSTEDSPS